MITKTKTKTKKKSIITIDPSDFRNTRYFEEIKILLIILLS